MNRRMAIMVFAADRCVVIRTSLGAKGLNPFTWHGKASYGSLYHRRLFLCIFAKDICKALDYKIKQISPPQPSLMIRSSVS